MFLRWLSRQKFIALVWQDGELSLKDWRKYWQQQIKQGCTEERLTDEIRAMKMVGSWRGRSMSKKLGKLVSRVFRTIDADNGGTISTDEVLSSPPVAMARQAAFASP